VPARIVDDLELVDVDESQYERLLSPSRPRYLALQLHEPRAPAIRPGQIVVGRMFALPRRRSPIGQSGVAIELGVGAFAGPCPAILRGSSSVRGSLSPGQR